MKYLSTLIFSSYCPLCKSPSAGNALCEVCQQSVSAAGRPCVRCGIALTERDETTESICHHCRQRPPPFERSICAFSYTPPIRYLVAQLKYHRQIRFAETLGCCLAERVEQRSEPLPELLLSVPLHRKRLIERGYNQAHQIACYLSKRLAIPYDRSLIKRCRDTPAQASLKAGQRKRNMRRAFVLARAIEVRHVAIVDDVMTTASTVSEIARLVKFYGVTSVEVWTLARA